MSSWNHKSHFTLTHNTLVVLTKDNPKLKIILNLITTYPLKMKSEILIIVINFWNIRLLFTKKQESQFLIRKSLRGLKIFWRKTFFLTERDCCQIKRGVLLYLSYYKKVEQFRSSCSIIFQVSLVFPIIYSVLTLRQTIVYVLISQGTEI